MGLFTKLKWLWDPRSDEEKAYAKWDAVTPLQRYTQHLMIYIKGTESPFERTIEFEDFSCGSLGNWRIDIDDAVREWLSKCGSKGIKLDNVWYAPDQIIRIELGKLETSDLVE